MRARTHLSLVFLLSASLLCSPAGGEKSQPMPGGELRILNPQGQPVGACPLKHTDVQADIVGFVGRVWVKQTFYNPLDTKVEAVYVFPLPQDAAVDEMIMTVGDRRIIGQVKPRDEAREVYEAAKAAGHVASLLDQERPNIFTQSVANIEPGAEVVIEIRYVETLKYEDGVFEVVFPMVVGPRYMPGVPVSQQGTGWSPDTSQVPDASRISPPVTAPGTRAGHDISLTVHLDAGLDLVDLHSVLHEVNIQELAPQRASVSLKNQTELPNKDFILRYRLGTDQIGDAFLTHSDERGDFFTLILQPPQRVNPEFVVPRELIFVLDTSGSMSGFPIEKAKEVMAIMIEAMRPSDTFNLITFAGHTQILWDQPRPNTPQNHAEAQAFLATRRGAGGTEMMKAIKAALVQTTPAQNGSLTALPIRVVCFMTDGYVGNDLAIIDAVKNNADTTRVFSFGIGNAVNRFLLDGMAHAGRGEVEHVTLAAEAEPAAQRFHQRVLAPVLTDIEVDWGDLPLADIYPKRIPDLFSAKPIMIHGRLTGPATGTIRLAGGTGAGSFSRMIAVESAAESARHEALASLWARAKVQHLMMQDMAGLQHGSFPDALRQEITALGVEFRLMTQFTSFVAVEEMTVTAGGEPVTIAVPVEMPEGVSYEGVFGKKAALFAANRRGLSALGYSLARRPVMSPSMQPPAVRGVRNQLGKLSAADAVNLDQVAADEKFPGEAKLAEGLRDLAEKVAQKGKDGNLSIGKLRVVDYRVDVMVFLADLSEETLKALERLGFAKTGESKAVRLLIGTIDVRKLEELAKLGAVIRVKPVVGP